MVKLQVLYLEAPQEKLKNYLQIGNKLYVNYNSKSDSKIGYFKLEIDKVLTPIYFDDKKKLSCILSAMNLIKILTADSQKNIKIFDSIQFFLIYWKVKFGYKNIFFGN